MNSLSHSPHTLKVMVSGTPTILTTTPQKIQVAAPAQKIITAKSQLLNPGASSTPKVLRTTSNLQQLLSQGTSSGQKIILNQANASGQRFIISTAGHQPAQQTIQAQKTIIQPQQQIIVNPAAPQKLMQVSDQLLLTRNSSKPCNSVLSVVG